MGNKRIIHTGLTSNVDYEIMASVFGQLSDGWGEGKYQYEKYWQCGEVDRIGDEVVILVEKSNVLCVSNAGRSKWSDNGFCDMSDEQVLAWMARMIKKTVKMDLSEHGNAYNWKRDNDYKLLYLGYKEKITVSDAYKVYDTLLKRNVKPEAYIKKDEAPIIKESTNTENNRIIDTGLTTNIAYEIMDSVFGQLSDGWGENNPRNDRFWEHGDAEIVDGKVVLSIDRNSTKHWWDTYTHRTVFKENGFYGMSDDEILTWMARMIKKTVKMELADKRDAIGWKRNNTLELRYLGRNETVTVSDAYRVYDTLLRRNIKPEKYLNKDEESTMS